MAHQICSLFMYTLLASLMTLLSFGPAKTKPEFRRSGLTITDQKVILLIDRKTTKAELLQYKADLKEKKNIQLDVDQLEFDDKQRIQSIKILVNCNDGFSGSATVVRPKTRLITGFIRNYAAEDTAPFSIGGRNYK